MDSGKTSLISETLFENEFGKDAKTLTVKGSIGPFFERMYWTKVD